ncbi:hypothetical protein J4210_04620 [Candidatus Woesearchaeota archaeon]|nr:hypothetical protein [Candidatus Woesearchaeota archaeon]
MVWVRVSTLVLRLYDRKKDQPEEEQRLPLYLPVPPPRLLEDCPHEKGEGLEIIIAPENEEGVIVIEL